MSDEQQPQEEGLRKSLKFIYVFAIATGAIFTFIGYWDSVFYAYCGPGTWLAFILMTLAVLPIAFVYCEFAPMFKETGAELCYNTIGINKHFGFFSTWFILLAYIAVPPAAVLAIIYWIAHIFGVNLKMSTSVIIGIVLIVVYMILSLCNVEIAGRVQLVMLIGAIAGCLITTVMLIFFSGQWSIHNLTNGPHGMFSSVLAGGGVGGWCIGLAMIITPFFGFEVVPTMVEEADFPVQKSTKAIWGSVVTCGVIYTLFFIAVCGMGDFNSLLSLDGAVSGWTAEDGFITILLMEQQLGWYVWPIIFGIFAVFCAIGTCVLGFWLSTVRLFYAMGRSNYLPKAFAKLNRFHQPIWANVLLMAISVVFLLFQLGGNEFMTNFFNLMAFGCGLTYTITSISSLTWKKKYPEWESPYKIPGGKFMKILALIISIAIMVGSCVGQGWGSWQCFIVYMAIGVVLWLTMLKKWKTEKVRWLTPSGYMEF